MSSEKNKEIVRRFYVDVFTNGRLELIDQLFAPNYIVHDPNQPDLPRGPAGARASVEGYRSAFPDLHFGIDSQLCEGDKVVTRFSSSGTNRGPLNGMPPTGKHATCPGISIDRIENGKIVETWVEYDLLGVLQQLGVVSVQQRASR